MNDRPPLLAHEWIAGGGSRRLRERETLIGSSPRRVRRLGIRLHPRATAASGASVSSLQALSTFGQSFVTWPLRSLSAWIRAREAMKR